MSENIIITRHVGLVQWLANHGITGEVIPHVSNPDQIKGKDVFGILPLNLAAVCNSITTVEMNLPPEKRGVDLIPEEMDNFGAKMARFKVIKEEI